MCAVCPQIANVVETVLRPYLAWPEVARLVNVLAVVAQNVGLLQEQSHAVAKHELVCEECALFA